MATLPDRTITIEGEVKRGARNSERDQQRLQMIHDYARENGAACEGAEPKSYRKSASDAPNLRGSQEQACANCNLFKYMPTGEAVAYTEDGAAPVFQEPQGICMKHDFISRAGWVCDDWEKFVPEPIETDDSAMLSLNTEDALVTYGSPIKSLGDGKVGGYLVKFSTPEDPDLEGDFFTKNTDFGDFQETDVYFHHRLPIQKDGKTFQFKDAIGKGTLRVDDVGVFMEAVIEMRGEYEAAVREIYQDAFMKLVESGKLGMSSGTAGHLVDRERVGNAYWIKKWPLALDASLTPTPAEYRTNVMPLKALLHPPSVTTDEGRSEKAQEMSGGETEAVIATKSNPTQQEATKEIPMAEKNEEAVPVSQPAPILEIDYDLLAQKMVEKLDTPVASKALPAQAPAVINPDYLGDPDPFKALTLWAQGGSAKGLGALGAKVDQNGKDLHFGFTKAALQENTASEGGALVPNDFYSGIVAKRDQMSIPRRAGARVFRTSRDILDIPVEDTSMTNFVKTAEEGSYDQNEPTFNTVQVNVYKFTKLIKISEELMEDEDANLDSFLTDAIGRSWALTENDLTLVGSGSSTVQGVFVGGTVGYTFADTNSITAPEIASLFWSLGDAYHEGAVWTMRGATMGHLQGLQGNPFSFLTTPAADTMQNVFFGNKPYYLSDSAAAIATGAKTIMLGNWNFYALVERRGLTLSRNPYLYQANGQIGLFCSVRMGGSVMQNEAFKWGIQA